MWSVLKVVESMYTTAGFYAYFFFWLLASGLSSYENNYSDSDWLF
jgi:hypothetical protein